jgi:phosphoribosylformylglycinamidine synthase
MRVEVSYLKPKLDGRAAKLLRGQRGGGEFPVPKAVETLDVFLLDQTAGLSPEVLSSVFVDPVVQRGSLDGLGAERSPLPDWTLALEISSRAGVTDPTAISAREALSFALGKPWPEGAIVQTAVLYLFRFESDLDPASLETWKKQFYNPLIQQTVLVTRAEWDAGRRFPELYPVVSLHTVPHADVIPLTQLSDSELQKLSRDRLLALSLEEMQAIRSYYADPAVQKTRVEAGLSIEPTDVELEMLAQTWSEHCKHKIFQAEIAYEDTQSGEKKLIRSLYSTYIQQTTRDLAPDRPWLRSVFHDNSGVVEFDENTLVCFKVETHNSPSALDPFGGAITGIVGVNRDILGTGKGAKPIFNTNFLCFGDPRTPPSAIPQGLLHPKKVLEGVHRGIVEGGNHSGIPTVAGGFLFDESYLGKPLVFCGTGGVLPARINGEDATIKHIESGDLAVMLGGRVGKDGIHGATFSSLALDEESPTSAVQIGDPITQKKMTDFLLEARDLGLFKGITDNGAGGLSSSFGEMAEASGGVRLDLDRCLLKYPGLAPWEILVSESQERMSLAVAPDRIEAFLDLARRRDVEGAVIGQFTDSGAVEAYYQNRLVAKLSMEFLHKGLPRMKLQAVWTPPQRNAVTLEVGDLKSFFLAVLADPVVASKESLVRQYDHEVQARSVVKPFCGEAADGPTDGAVLRLNPWSPKALTVTHGVCPRYGDSDTYAMAMNAVDEAYRSHIALGGDPDRASVLDNFCWPDPVLSPQTPDGPYKLAQLVRACQGLRDACLAYGLPLISGKDSMKNDAVMNGKKVSIRPTLLVSLMGSLDDVNKVCTTDFLKSGDLVILLGETRSELAGTIAEKIFGGALQGVPSVFPQRVLSYYKALSRAVQKGLVQSAHDLSDGGLAVALAESVIGGRLGALVTLDELPGFLRSQSSDAEILFSETPSRFLLTVSPANLKEFQEVLGTAPMAILGVVTEEPRLVVESRGKTLLRVELDELLTAWNTLAGLV